MTAPFPLRHRLKKHLPQGPFHIWGYTGSDGQKIKLTRRTQTGHGATATRYLVGAFAWIFDAERLRSLEVDDQLERGLPV